MAFDVVVLGGLVASDSGVTKAEIGIIGGRVAAVEPTGTGISGETTIDATGKYVLPGAIDTHTNMEWPFDGTASADTFQSGTAAAALGGTTTAIDFVPVAVGESALASAEARLRRAEGQAFIDYSFHPILTSADSRTLNEIPSLIRDGFASFKTYTTYDNGLDDGAIWSVMRVIAEHGGLAGFHAENEAILGRALRAHLEAGHVSLRDFPATRPQIAEAEAISMVSFFARRLGAPVWIFHVSSEMALVAIEEARAAGTRIDAETCTHYLTFNDRVFLEPDAWRFAITPPIRDLASQDALWDAVIRGSLSAICSDHCAYSSQQKAAGREDFTKLPFGAPGIDARVPVFWSRGVSEGRISVADFVRITATRPAQALGMYPRKGALLPGSDADLLVIDPDVSWTFPETPMPGGSDYSLYAGLRLKGRPVLTMVRGQVVVRDGQIVGRPGHGVFVPRSLRDSATGGPLAVGGESRS